MANQPKKYKKFVATAATATLVASAIVPVASAASFSDVPDNHEFKQYIDELVKAEIIKGYPDGTFGINKQLKRSDVVKLLGRYLEQNGVEVPADWATVQRFNDLPVTAPDQELVKYAALVKDAGVFTGSNGNLNYAQNIQRQQMAKVLNNAYEKINGKSLIDLAAEIEDVKVADLDKAFDEFRPYIQALADLKITTVENFRPADPVTRGQFAKFLSITIKGGDVSTPEPAEVEIASLTATGVSELTVKFNKAVDTEAAQFKVTKGSTEIKVTDIDWNEEKTEAVLTVDERFFDATYTVTVSGVAEKELTASVKTTREQVTTIQFLSDKLLLTGREAKDGNDEYKEAVIAFAVYNQYGEDITKSISKSYYKDLKVKGIDVYDNGDKTTLKNPYFDDGKIVVWVDEDEDEGATGTIKFTYERNDVEIDVEQEVELSDEAEVSKVDILDIYSPTGDELSVKNLQKNNKDFYILFNAYDQYGVQIDAKFANKVASNKSTNDTTLLEQVQDGLRIDVADDDIFDVVDEEEIEVLNVDGKYYFAIKLDGSDTEKGGENTVTFRSRHTGEESSKVFYVSDAKEAYKIEIELPDDVVAGDETVYLPVNVYNSNGELIVDATKLNEDASPENKKIKVDLDGAAKNNAYTFVEKDGKVFLRFKTVDNKTDEAKEYDINIEVDESGYESEVTLSVEPNAHPERIAGLKNKAKAYAIENDQIEFELKDLIILDQYGRVYDDISTDDGSYKGYTITAKSSNSAIIELPTDDNGVTKLGPKTVFLSKQAGSATITFTLTGKDLKGKMVKDEFDVTFRSLEASDFDSFVVKSDGVLNVNSTEDTAGIEVYGKVGNLEVEIFNINNAFAVEPVSKYLTLNNYGEVIVNESTTRNDYGLISSLDDEGESVNAEVLVTINETGEVIKHVLSIVNEDPRVEKKFVIKDTSTVSESKLDSIDLEITNSETINLERLYEIIEENSGAFDIKDQFDQEAEFVVENEGTTAYVKFKDGTKSRVVFTVSNINSTNDKNVVTNNGTNKLQLLVGTVDGKSGLQVGDTFDLTISIDGKSQTIKVYAVQGSNE